MTVNSLQVSHFALADFPGGSSTVLDVEEVSFLADLGSAGNGSVTMRYGDADAASPAPGDIFAIDIIGDDAVVHPAFAFIFQDADYKVIDQAEEFGQTVTFTGPGLLGILADALIEPPGGVGRSPIVTDVHFDFTHPDYDEATGTWTGATTMMTVEDGQTTWGPPTWATTMPAHAIAGVGSGTTEIIWSADGTPTSAPAGWRWFRAGATGAGTFSTPFDGLHYVFFTVDNAGSIYIDNKQISAGGGEGESLESGFNKTQITPVSLSAGDHTIAVKAQNFASFGGANPGGIAVAVYIPGYPPTLVFESTSSTMNVSDDAEVPGMTPGTVLRLIVEAQQALGRWTYVSLSFDDVNDTDGNPWPTFAQIAARAGSDSVYSLVQKLMTVYADVEMRSDDWILDAWIWGDRDPSSGVTFEVGNLTSLNFHRQRKTADELLVLWTGGFSRVAPGGEVQAFLQLGPEDTEDEIGRIGGQIVAQHGNPREQVTFAYKARDDTELPWVNANFVPGATATMPTRTGGTNSQRMPQIGCSYTKDAEYVMVTVNARDIVAQEQERILNTLKEL